MYLTIVRILLRRELLSCLSSPFLLSNLDLSLYLTRVIHRSLVFSNKHSKLALFTYYLVFILRIDYGQCINKLFN